MKREIKREREREREFCCFVLIVSLVSDYPRPLLGLLIF